MLARIEAFEANPPAERPAISPPRQTSHTQIDLKAHFDEASYCQAVTKIKEHIFVGDIFEACLTHRLESPLEGGSPWDLYEELRRVNPAPFACYLNFPEAQVVSASPERFLSLDNNRIAESRPIKGTRPRGTSSEEDERLCQDLFHSIKDRAENVMIVDLVRNDFGRVCKFHTVNVPELMIIEPYATVFQMVSTIRGELKADVFSLDLIKACFPGGSMTGAPKIEAMKIIDRLEPVKRGIYSGSIGYLDFSGPLDFNIVIRSFVVRDKYCYYNVGGAVVADSDPREEYAETMDKARALKTALTNLKARDRLPS
jgi:aminodeoxychorismate synthase component I